MSQTDQNKSNWSTVSQTDKTVSQTDPTSGKQIQGEQNWSKVRQSDPKGWMQKGLKLSASLFNYAFESQFALLPLKLLWRLTDTPSTMAI